MIFFFEIKITVEHLPETINAFTVQRKDGSYWIAISNRLNAAEQAAALEHEKLHILNGDFEKDQSADDIEKAAHGT